MDGDRALEHVAKFLSLMGVMGTGGAFGLQGKKNGLHYMLLGIGDDPFNFII